MKLAIIGGSLFSEIKGLVDHSEENIKTPYGEPSSSIISGKMNNTEVVYLNRHGNIHQYAPHQINYRANMFALKRLGVTHIIAITAVGGITKKMSPMKWLVPDQIIDYTYGREQTYNDEHDADVNHIDFSHPFDQALRDKLITTLDNIASGYETKATYAATQGPRLETIAEIKRLQNDGCDIVGMTAMPEAALARELNIPYATLSLVVNWAAGKTDVEEGAVEIVSMDAIKERIKKGNAITDKIIQNLVTILT